MRGNGQSLILLLAPEISTLAGPKPGSVGALDTEPCHRLQVQLRLEAARLCQCGAVFNQTHLELGCNAGKGLVFCSQSRANQPAQPHGLHRLQLPTLHSPARDGHALSWQPEKQDMLLRGAANHPPKVLPGLSSKWILSPFLS